MHVYNPTERACLESRRPVIMGCIQRMDSLGVEWPTILGYFAFQVVSFGVCYVCFG